MVAHYCNFVGGAWIDGGDAIENRNPSDLSDVIGSFAQADADQCHGAIDAARQAQPAWNATGLEARYKALMAIGDELIARAPELGEQLSREEGKPRAEGVGEVYRSGQFFHYYGAEILRQLGETADSVRPGIEVETRREPMGVVAVITPWNFPIATAAWKIAPALAFGNAVVWKPANEVPYSAWALADIISRQELPPGTFNLVMGAGSTLGAALVASPAIDAITFTGSLSVGRGIASAAARNLTKFQLEMGSKNALVIMEDGDLDVAVSSALNGAFFGTGQKCTASSRLIVHDAVHDEFLARMTDGMQGLKVGHALADDTQIGPVVNARQLGQNLDYMELARQEGARHVWGGERVNGDTEGYFMSPALFTDTRNDMRVNREEMFAPIACVIPVADYEEALATVNDTEFGLTSGIVTRSLARATHFKRNARTGVVTINLPTAGTDYHVPFGGRGNSSFGSREQGRYAAEFYTQVKTTYISAGAP